MDRRRYSRNPRKAPKERRKTAYEREQTHEEVKQIKQDLINFASTHWGKYWISALLEQGRPFRMQRGIDYAENDERIGNLTINPGQIFATVQGTAPLPYRVKISLETIPEEGWKEIIEDLRKKLMNIISLLEGKLPDEIIQIFKTYDYPLFPEVITPENAECSCPDKAVPCKHIASVILYLARVIDFNPFILMELRGKTKQELFLDLSISKSRVKQLEKQEQTKMDVEDLESSNNVPKMGFEEIKKRNKNPSAIKDIGFQFKKPGKIIETLANLGLPENLEEPLAFGKTLKSIYKTVTSEGYKIATKIDLKND